MGRLSHINSIFRMKQSGHLNPSYETGAGCPITLKYGRTHPNKHGGVSLQHGDGDRHWDIEWNVDTFRDHYV